MQNCSKRYSSCWTNTVLQYDKDELYLYGISSGVNEPFLPLFFLFLFFFFKEISEWPDATSFLRSFVHLFIYLFFFFLPSLYFPPFRFVIYSTLGRATLSQIFVDVVETFVVSADGGWPGDGGGWRSEGAMHDGHGWRREEDDDEWQHDAATS